MRWRPHNRDGTPVDPVPFLVVVLSAFLVTHAWGPIYLGALGFDPGPAFAILTAVWLAVAAVSYHRLVWTAYPDRPRVASADQRLSQLLYAILAGIGLVVLLSLPFLR